MVVAADTTCAAAGVFTKSRFAGPSVHVSREHLDGRAAPGRSSSSPRTPTSRPVRPGSPTPASWSCGVADRLGCEAADVVVASTGVIGRPYPMDRIRAGIAAFPASSRRTGADDAARGIMTTDTVAKVAEAPIGTSGARVVGIAKGVGMIEPDMATMITVLFTDAEIEPAELDRGRSGA